MKKLNVMVVFGKIMSKCKVTIIWCKPARPHWFAEADDMAPMSCTLAVSLNFIDIFSLQRGL